LNRITKQGENMKSKLLPDKCPLCGGDKKEGRTTFAVDLGIGVVVVRDVPATVCSQCGADWIEDKTASKLERIVNDAKKRHNMVEITSLAV
jgi:YgiT-type zinc finger domain-containing protein